MKLNFFTVLVVLFFNTVFSQNEEVLFTVNNTAVTTNEFSRVYNKNIDLVQDEKQKDVDEYLKLYVNYKLKLEEAYALGLDKDKKYKKANTIAIVYITLLHSALLLFLGVFFSEFFFVLF